MTVASLPMYDLPELRAATDDWWRGLARELNRAGLPDVPEALRRDTAPPALWRDPDLLFSQTCGYPLVHAFQGVLQPVATPVYDAAGCAGPSYSSAVVVRADEAARDLADLRQRRCAINNRESHSGYNVLRYAVAPLSGGQPFFAEVVETGGHKASLEAVAGRVADVAAVDCVTFALLGRADPALVRDVRVLAWSEPAPGLPYVTKASASAETLARLREGLTAAFAAPDLQPAREALLLAGAEILPLEAYNSIMEMERTALDLGYGDVA